MSTVFRLIKPRRPQFAGLIILLLLSSCSTTVTTTENPKNQPVKSPVPSSTSMPTDTYTVSPTYNSPKSTASVTPVVGETLYKWDMKIAYIDSFFVSGNKNQPTRIMILAEPYQSAREVFTFEPGTGWGNWITWAHTGRYIAIEQIVNENNEVVILLNIDNSEKQEILLDEMFGEDVRLYRPVAWSSDDQWLAITIERPETRKLSTVLVNVTTNERKYIDGEAEFVAWSDDNYHSYLYLLHREENFPSESPKEKRPLIIVGQLSQDEPISMIDLGDLAPIKYFEIQWSPDSTRAISFSDIINYTFRITDIDTREGTWKLLPTLAGMGIPWGWSPNGEWIVFMSPGPYIWKYGDYSSESLEMIQATQDFVIPSGWTPDSQFIVIQEGSDLFEVAPTAPDKVIPLLDLQSIIGSTNKEAPQFYLWFST